MNRTTEFIYFYSILITNEMCELKLILFSTSLMLYVSRYRAKRHVLIRKKIDARLFLLLLFLFC